MEFWFLVYLRTDKLDFAGSGRGKKEEADKTDYDQPLIKNLVEKILPVCINEKLPLFELILKALASHNIKTLLMAPADEVGQVFPWRMIMKDVL